LSGIINSNSDGSTGEILTRDESICNPRKWAEDEFGNIDLGHRGRTKRLVKISASMAGDPSQAMSNSCGTNGAQSVGELFGNPDVTFDAIMNHHIKKTVERTSQYDWVMVVQDTTPLDFSSHEALEGIGYYSTGKKAKGFLLHTGMAFSPDGVPLGLLSCKLWTRRDEDYGRKKTRKQRPFEEKESFRWYDVVRNVESETPDDLSTLITGDRESDIYELYARPRRKNIHLLSRVARFDRIVVVDGEKKKLREAVESAKSAGTRVLRVKRKRNRPERDARLDIKFFRVTLPPSSTGDSDVNVEMYCVYALEKPQKDEGIKDPIEWCLLTTLPIESFDEAVDLLDKYGLRWSIETFHRNLKSICGVEKLQFRTLNSLLPAMATTLVMAWRVSYLSRMSRVHGDEKAEKVAEPHEIAALKAHHEARWDRVKPIDTVRDFVREVAVLGGFLARKCDGEPGPKHIMRGLSKLEPLALGWRVAFELGRQSVLESDEQLKSGQSL